MVEGLVGWWRCLTALGKGSDDVFYQLAVWYIKSKRDGVLLVMTKTGAGHVQGHDWSGIFFSTVLFLPC